MFKQLNAPVYVQWEVTPSCNFECIHCYNAWRKNKKKEYVHTDLYSITTAEIIKNRVFHVTITGGEPLLVFEEISPYLEQLKMANIDLSINTNATLVTEHIAQKLKNLGITHALVSVPCGKPEICDDITKYHRSLINIMHGIKLLIKNGIVVSVNMVITKKNIEYIYDTAKIFKNIPISTFGATRAATPCEYQCFNEFRISTKEMSRMFDELIRIESDFQIRTSSFEFYPYCSFTSEEHFNKFGTKICSAGRTEVAISYTGDIKTCPHVGKSYGHINNGLKNAWLSMDSEWRQEKNIPIVCKSCLYRESCTGGCRQEAFSCFGAYDEIDPIANPVCSYRRIIMKKQSLLGITYRLVPNLQSRKEEEDTILLYVSIKNWILLKARLAEWLFKKMYIKADDLARELKIEKDMADAILTKLLLKGIIMIWEK